MALSSKIKAAVKKAAGKFKKTKAADGGGFTNEAVPDDSYSATLTGAELKEMGGKAVIVLSYTIGDEEDPAGEVVTSRYNLETDENLSYLKRDLGRFVDGVDEMDLVEELESTLEGMVEAAPDCRISVRMKDEYQNVYLNKVDIATDEEDEEDEEDEDAKPKGKGKGKKAKTASGGKGGKKGGKGSKADEEDEDEEDAPEISKGDSVLFTPPRAKKAKVCTVVSIKGTKAKLEDEDGNEYPGILLSVLEPADEEDADEDEEDAKPKGKGKGGKSKPKPKGKGKKDEEDEDEEDEEDEDEEVELDVGSKVIVNYKGKEAQGTVKAINEEDETVKVRFKHGGEFVVKTVPADSVEAA